MKKILIFAPTAPGSGVTQYILNLLGEADLSKFQFDILSFHNGRLERWAGEHGGRYYDLTVSLYKHPIQYRKYLKSVFSNGYDIVHYHFSSLSTLRVFKYARQCSIPKIIIQSHGSGVEAPTVLRHRVFEAVHKLVRRPALKYYDILCSCSEQAAEWMFGRAAAQNAVILNNAIDLERFVFCEEDRNKIRKKYGVGERFVIGHVGRFSEVKNHPFLLNVFSCLQKKRGDYFFMLIGEGALRVEIERYAKELGLSDSVCFVDFQEDIYKYYSAMDLFVLPSFFESFPIVLIEAQANGLCGIASNHVPESTNASGRIEYWPLEDGCEAWADRIDQKRADYKRVQTTNILAERGFSLAGQAKHVFRFYES